MKHEMPASSGVVDPWSLSLSAALSDLTGSLGFGDEAGALVVVVVVVVVVVLGDVVVVVAADASTVAAASEVAVDSILAK